MLPDPFFPKNPLDASANTPAIRRIADVPHTGKWHELQPFFEALPPALPSLPPNAVIIFGGWILPPPKGLSDGVMPPPDQLFFDLLSFEFHTEVLERFDRSWKRGHVPGEEHLRTDYRAFVDKHQIVFGDLPANKVSEKAVAALLPDLKRAFHFMQNQAFLFSPVDTDPLRGWVDFLDFVRAYNAFPELLRYTFAPYYMIILVP